MNLNSMEYFIALAEERSFTRAAERLSITQQTLSAHIASVERELGVRLVNRKVPLTLTYAGEVLLGYARRIDTDHRALVQEFADIAGDAQGLLRVGIGSTRGRLLMPQAIAEFRAQKPGVRIAIVEEENEELVESLREGRVDMVVATVPANVAGLEVQLLRTEQIVLLVSWDLLHTLYGERAGEVVITAERSGSLAPLVGCPFLLLGRHDEPGGLSRRLIDMAGLDTQPAILSSNSETLVELALRHVGATFVPVDLVQRMVAERGRWWQGSRPSKVPATRPVQPESGRVAAQGSETAYSAPSSASPAMCTIDLGEAARIDIHVAWRASDHVWSVIKDFSAHLRRLADEGALV